MLIYFIIIGFILFIGMAFLWFASMIIDIYDEIDSSDEDYYKQSKKYKND